MGPVPLIDGSPGDPGDRIHPGGEFMKKFRVGALAAVAMLAFAACSGTGGGGGGKGEIEIWSSLPRQGSSKAQTDTEVNAIKMAIEDKAGAAGGYTIKFSDKDDSTAAAGKWDEATEIKNANDAVANDKLMAYIGTQNSGAAKLSIPILCAKGILMVSPANTYPGLTKAGKGEADEPDKYYPNGCARNYHRTVAADDLQGLAGAKWALKLGAKNVYVLDDTELYGKGVADVFNKEAPGVGLTVLGRDSIDGKATDYKALAEKVKATSPDLVYFGGITQNNAGQLWRDLRDAMPDVKLMGPDGILENEWIAAAGDAAEGTYVTFGGLPPDKLTGKGADFLKNYNAKYPNAPAEAYTAYAYEAASAILAGIEKAAATNPADMTALRAAVLKAVHETKDFDGVLGKWSFNEEGDTSLTAMSGNIVKGGKFEFDSVIE
jgi:branched-chain amino acid transport system substrate-binding protein